MAFTPIAPAVEKIAKLRKKKKVHCVCKELAFVAAFYNAQMREQEGAVKLATCTA